MSKYTGINLLDKVKECIDAIGDYTSNIEDNLSVTTIGITDPSTQSTITVVTGIKVNKSNLSAKLKELEALYVQFHSEYPD